MTSRTANLVAQLSTLDAKELAEVSARLQALQAVSGTAVRTTDIATELYLCMSEAMLSLKGMRPMPLPVFKKQKLWPKFVESANIVEDFVTNIETDRLRKLAFRKWCCSLVLQHLAANDMYSGWNAIIWGMDNLASIIEESFPGYLASGLLGHVINSLTTPKRGKPVLNRAKARTTF